MNGRLTSDALVVNVTPGYPAEHGNQVIEIHVFEVRRGILYIRERCNGVTLVRLEPVQQFETKFATSKTECLRLGLIQEFPS